MNENQNGQQRVLGRPTSGPACTRKLAAHLQGCSVGGPGWSFGFLVS